TGPWVFGKLELVRFHNRAWGCRANMPGSKHGIPHPPPSGAPSPKGEGFGRPIPLPSPLGEGVTRSVMDEVSGQRPPAGRSGTGPYEEDGTVSVSAQGQVPSPARRSSEPHLSPTHTKARSPPIEETPKVTGPSAAAEIEGKPVS